MQRNDITNIYTPADTQGDSVVVVCGVGTCIVHCCEYVALRVGILPIHQPVPEADPTL